MSKTHLEKAKEYQINYLKNRICYLEKFKANTEFIALPPFDYNKIREGVTIKSLSQGLPDKGKYLYYFTVNKADDIININELFKVRPLISEKPQKINYTKINDKHTDSLCLYVGGSNSLRKRFEEHCGKVSDTTYALKLFRWLKGSSIKINFFYLHIDTDHQITLQDFEDGLWEELKPIFGKYGAN